jgi:hypothetical protein
MLDRDFARFLTTQQAFYGYFWDVIFAGEKEEGVKSLLLTDY